MKKPLLTLLLLLVAIPAIQAQRYRGFTPEYTRFRIGAHGGWSYMTAKVAGSLPPFLKPYIKELKSGYHYGADASYFLTPSLGLGVKYTGFRTSNELHNIYTEDTAGVIRQGSIKDNITIQYIGPVMYTRLTSENQAVQFLTSISAGYLSYKNNAMLIDEYVLKSSTLGLAFGIGGDFAITQGLYLGAEISATFGSLSYYHVYTGNTLNRVELDTDEREGISRIDASAGIRWNFLQR